MSPAAQSKEKVKEALEILNEAAQDEKQELKQLLGNKYGDLRSFITDVEHRVEDKAGRGVERVVDFERRAEARARDSKERVEAKVHEQPWHAMGVAAVGALVLGYLMGRK